MAPSRFYHRLLRIRDNMLSYNLTKEYPFPPWAKWLICIIFVVLLGFFTVFNIAANGWDLQPLYTMDPNSTEAERSWYQSNFFTWGDDKLDPICQHMEIPVGYQFTTTNLGLLYTVTGVQFQQYGSKVVQQYPSLSYINNALENCQVDSVYIVLRKNNNSPPARNDWWSWMDSYAVATAHCNLPSDDGLYTVSLTAKYETLSTLYNYVAVDNATSHASIWWGTRMLNNYFVGTQYVMTGELPGSPNNKTPEYMAAGMTFIPGRGNSIKGTDLFDLTFFYFLQSDGSIINTFPNGLDTPYNNLDWGLSQPMTEGLFFSKVFSSLVLVDLGNVDAPNVLLDPELLQYALNPPDDSNRQPGGPLFNGSFSSWRYDGISPPSDMILEQNTAVPMHQSYAMFSNQTGTLGTHPATVYTQYICSAPMRKGRITVALLVLVADYALVQTAWLIVTFFMNMYVEKKYLNANFCERCVAQWGRLGHAEPLELSPRDRKRAENIHSNSSRSTCIGLLAHHDGEGGDVVE